MITELSGLAAEYICVDIVPIYLVDPATGFCWTVSSSALKTTRDWAFSAGPQTLEQPSFKALLKLFFISLNHHCGLDLSLFNPIGDNFELYHEECSIHKFVITIMTFLTATSSTWFLKVKKHIVFIYLFFLVCGYLENYCHWWIHWSSHIWHLRVGYKGCIHLRSLNLNLSLNILNLRFIY